MKSFSSVVAVNTLNTLNALNAVNTLNNAARYETVIGLEIHVRLKASLEGSSVPCKLFSHPHPVSSNLPNTFIAPFDVALPGTLPILQTQTAVPLAVRAALALGCDIQPYSFFERKHYLWHDLPLTYQITQRSYPFAKGGHWRFTSDKKLETVRIQQLQLEQDTARSVLEGWNPLPQLDYNRCGMPLIEVVCEPCLHSSEAAVQAVRSLFRLLRQVGVTEAVLDDGAMRCDVNVSILDKETGIHGARTEIKNVASFRGIRNAIDYERERQIQLFQSNQIPSRVETRALHGHETRPLRDKISAEAYRYTLDTDIPPLYLSKEDVAEVEAAMPRSLVQQEEILMKMYSLSDVTVKSLLSVHGCTDYFEACFEALSHPSKETLAPKVAHWILTELLGRLNRNQTSLTLNPIRAQVLAQILDKVFDGQWTDRQAKQILSEMIRNNQTELQHVCHGQVTDMELEQWCDEVLLSMPEQVAQIKSGRLKALQSIMGRILQQHPTCEPRKLQDILKRKLSLL